uniref:Phosphoacetylglucosamine mutase n=1 Tax=Chlamydomonas leiostraca TaxID=1034604 RepID=A0A7S0WZQ3_9CHLO
MLTQAWEPLATELACASCDNEVSRLLSRLLEQSEGGAPPTNAKDLAVFIGCDTRPSAGELVAAAKAGVEAMGLHVLDLGEVSTPQLHFQVASINSHKLKWSPPTHGLAASAVLAQPASTPPSSSLTDPLSLDLYFDSMLSGFEQLLPAASSSSSSSAADTLYVDCANGVGAKQLAKAAERLSKSGIKLVLINDGAPGHCGLNNKCGADYVQKEKVAPAGFESVPAGSRCCSIDGDADRLVYFTLDEPASTSGQRRVGLLDGDKVAALTALLVRDLIAGLPAEEAAHVKVGVVQTAYANGASTTYLTQDLGLEVACTKTGVKHLHEVAHSYDVGVYFEANGHGTALFSKPLLSRLAQLEDSNPAAKQLLALSRVINQSVGDALSCILAVELALRRKGWDCAAWQGLYTDLPSRQTKLGVKDRAAITTTDAERKCVKPAGLQDAVDAAVKEAGPQARAFVRPSGTEDCVRVYAEAAGTQAAADALALKVMQAVWDLAGGTGPRPE